MVDPNLVRHIQTNLARGFPLHEIRQRLLAQGVSDYDIQVALNAIKQPSQLDQHSPQKVKKDSRKRMHAVFWIIFGAFLVILIILLIILLTSDKPLKSNLTIDEARLIEGIEANLLEGSTINFELDSQFYTFKIEDVNKGFVQFSGDVTRKVNMGDEVFVDFGNDGFNDLSITFEKYEKGKAFLILEGFQSFDCPENWNCTNWSGCVNGERIRLCVDLNSCSTEDLKPSTVESCEDNSSGEDVVNVSGGDENESILDCSAYVAPDCGVINDSNAFQINYTINGTNYSRFSYEKDCALLCMGKSFLKDCTPSYSIFPGSVEFMDVMSYEILGVSEGNCSIKSVLIEKVEEDNETEVGDYFVCSWPLVNLTQIPCSLDGSYCPEKEEFGDFAMGIYANSLLMYALGGNETGYCQGTLPTLFEEF